MKKNRIKARLSVSINAQLAAKIRAVSDAHYLGSISDFIEIACEDRIDYEASPYSRHLALRSILTRSFRSSGHEHEENVQGCIIALRASLALFPAGDFDTDSVQHAASISVGECLAIGVQRFFIVLPDGAPERVAKAWARWPSYQSSIIAAVISASEAVQLISQLKG